MNSKTLLKIGFAYVAILAMLGALPSCKKYLDEKPDRRINTITSLADLELLLDYYPYMNNGSPAIGELASDDYYLKDADWQAALPNYRNFYTWQKDDNVTGDWSSPYAGINYANVALEYLLRISILPNEQSRAARVKGYALFYRAFYHFALVQHFGSIYVNGSANEELGIPVRTSSDINSPSPRATVAGTYDQIITDLMQAKVVLPAMPDLKSRPSKAAVMGLLARIYVSMGKYEEAGRYADSCLGLYNKLINYNGVNTGASTPFAQFNDEVIFDARSISTSSPLTRAKGKIDSVLYKSYNERDKRRAAFFIRNNDNTIAFKGNYSGATTAAFFTGIATDEVYLIRSEARVRGGNINGAREDLNELLKNRIETGYFEPVVITDKEELLQIILLERRKELVSRCMRWIDLRRFSKDAQLAKTISRKVDGQLYELIPGSPRYVFQISREAMLLGNYQQNP